MRDEDRERGSRPCKAVAVWAVHNVGVALLLCGRVCGWGWRVRAGEGVVSGGAPPPAGQHAGRGTMRSSSPGSRPRFLPSSAAAAAAAAGSGGGGARGTAAAAAATAAPGY